MKPSLWSAALVALVAASPTLGQVYTVGGTVYTDLGDPLQSGLENVTVTLDGDGGTFVTTSAGTDGAWTIADVPEGIYTVTPVLAGWSFQHVDGGAPGQPDAITITVDAANEDDNTHIEFLASAGGCGPFDIGGAIYEDCGDPGGSGVAGLTVCVICDGGFSSCADTAGPQGAWQIAAVPCDTCTVGPLAQAEWQFCHVNGSCPPVPCTPETQIIVDEPNQAENQDIQFLACGNCGDGVDCTIDGCVGGVCQNVPSDALCDDGVGCTEDSCDAANGCQFVPNDAVCNDGVGCTEDSCDAVNDCQFAPNNSLCDDGVACTDNICDPANGCEFAANDALCDDGVGCTADTCDPVGGCQSAAQDALCDDGISCTIDSCDAVDDCQYDAQDVLCDDGVGCTNDTCDPSNDCQFAPDDGLCDDGVDCSIDSCDPLNDCQHLPDDAFCAEDPNDVCTDDFCDVQLGCFNAEVDNCCVEDADCDQAAGEACDLSTNRCRRTCSISPDCNDENDCTVDQCTDGFCFNDVLLPDGEPCEDGFFCTLDETCQGGECMWGSLNPLCEGEQGPPGPPGPPGGGGGGAPGPPGPEGPAGISCWDLDGDGVGDPDEDINQDGDFSALDCSGDGAGGGQPGAPGASGESCWDLNGNGIADPDEDVNGDEVVDVLDCQGAAGADGADGMLGLSCWDLDGDRVGDPEEDTNQDGDLNSLDCRVGLNFAFASVQTLPPTIGPDGAQAAPTVFPAIPGQVVLIPAPPAPAAGLVFDHWEGDVPEGGQSDDPLLLTLDRDKSLRAVYVEGSEPPTSVGICGPPLSMVTLALLSLLCLRLMGRCRERTNPSCASDY